MSQNILGSPSKKTRHDSTSSTYLGNHVPESPTQQTRTGANSEPLLFSFDDFTNPNTPTFGVATPTPMNLPSQVPNSKDWMMSPTAAPFSAVPVGFGADPLSPGFSTGAPSRIALKLGGGGGGHQRGFRSAHKRGVGVGSSSVMYNEDDDFDEDMHMHMGHIDNDVGIGGLSRGIALSPGSAVVDEESLEGLNTKKEALADILSRKSNRQGGRATPDMSNNESEGSRYALSSALRGSHDSYSNHSLSYSNGSHANHAMSSSSNNKHNNNIDHHSNSSSNTTSSSANNNSSTQVYTTSFPLMASARAGTQSGGTILDSISSQATSQATSQGASKPKRGAVSKQKAIKVEKEVAHSLMGESTTASTTGTSTAEGEAESREGAEDSNNCNNDNSNDDGESSNQQSSQQSSQQSNMAGVLAITAAAEYFPFPSSDEKKASGAAGKGARGGSARSPVKKSKVRRSYTVPSSGGAYSTGTEGVKLEGPDGEHSNLSCGSNNSGDNAAGGLGLVGGGSGGGGKSSSSAASNANSAQASYINAFGTPAMKLATTIMTASASKPITCNCKRSRCLKMYCDCFRLTLYCKDTCRCKECANVESKAAERQAAISSIVERNPEAFKPRVTADPVSQSKGHLTGCHCRKSSCLKKYCECFTGSVPCGDRCRCLDCRNVAEMYSGDLKNRLSLSAAMTQGIDRSKPRKDSIGSDGNMDVMSAIMNDKRQYNSILAQHAQSLGSPYMSMSLGAAPYFDPEMSNLSAGSMSYSNDAFRPGSLYDALNVQFNKSDSNSKLAFSPPRPGTDHSSGANSNRSVLDNEEAAEVLSVMNSPNAYMQPFGGHNHDGGNNFRYRDTAMSSVGTENSLASHSRSIFGKSLLPADFDEEGEDEGEDADELLSHSQSSQPGSGRVRDVARQTAGLGLNIDTEDPVPAVALSSSYLSPGNSAYNSPIKPRRPITENMVLSPTLLDLAALCEQKAEEEEERIQQLTSPLKQRTYP